MPREWVSPLIFKFDYVFKFDLITCFISKLLKIYGEKFKDMDAQMRRSRLKIRLDNANAKMDLNAFGQMKSLSWDARALLLQKLIISLIVWDLLKSLDVLPRSLNALLISDNAPALINRVARGQKKHPLWDVPVNSLHFHLKKYPFTLR